MPPLKTREIVLSHGGDIEVSSGATEGTTFRVTLPRERRIPAVRGGPTR